MQINTIVIIILAVLVVLLFIAWNQCQASKQDGEMFELAEEQTSFLAAWNAVWSRNSKFQAWVNAHYRNVPFAIVDPAQKGTDVIAKELAKLQTVWQEFVTRKAVTKSVEKGMLEAVDAMRKALDTLINLWNKEVRRIDFPAAVFSG